MEVNLKTLEEVLSKYEITIAEANDLVVLQGYRVIVLADDSTSMNITDEKDVKTEQRQCMSCSGSGTMNGMPCESCKGRCIANYVVGQVASRWDELRETLASLIEIVACIIPGGTDVHFLNGPSITALRSATDPRLVQQFAAGPQGNTPLTETLQKVVQQVGREELPVLLMILTDGEPDGGSNRFRQVVQSVIRKEITETTYKFQIMPCTDDHTAVQWLDEFDKEFEAVDVTDDYKSEKAQVMSCGKTMAFRRSDWIMKALLGPLSQKFDGWDEEHKSEKDKIIPECQCCVM